MADFDYRTDIAIPCQFSRAGQLHRKAVDRIVRESRRASDETLMAWFGGACNAADRVAPSSPTPGPEADRAVVRRDAVHARFAAQCARSSTHHDDEAA
jgi:hypothetical protein